MSKFIDVIRGLRSVTIRTYCSFTRPHLPLPSIVIIFAPHPDDEVFGCCGLMQRMLVEGRRVELIIMTGGGKSHSSCCDINEEELIRNRRQLTRNAATIYGLPEEHIHFLDYPDGGVSVSDENTKLLDSILKKIVDSCAESDLAVFYPHSVGEGWSDHLRTSEIAKQLCATICPEAKQYEYCVWFWFYNCWRIDWKNAFTLKMTKQEHANKLQAIQDYVTPIAPCGKPWSGTLPKIMVEACKWKRELYFETSL